MTQTKAELINGKGDVTFDTNTLFIDAVNNRVGIATTSPATTLNVQASAGEMIRATVSSNIGLYANIGADGNGGWFGSNADLAFKPSGTERLRIDSSGRFLVGTSSAGGTELIQVQGVSSSSTAPGGIALRRSSIGNTDDIGFINFTNASGNIHAQIKAICDGTPGASDYPGAITFSTTADGASSPTERMRIDSSGRLLVGTSTARSPLTHSPSLQVEGVGYAASTASVFGNSNDTNGSYVFIGKSRGTAVGSNTVVQSGDEIGGLDFIATDGTQALRAARITALVDGTPGANDMPGRLVFSTTADGASSPTERMRLDSAGEINIFAATGRTVFGARSATGAGTTDRLIAGIHSATSTTLTGTISFQVFTNGNTQNTNNSYAGISDIKLKENIVDSGSQWADIKALQVRKYNFKEGQTHTQIGLVAQEVELVSPGLVTESPDRDAAGNDLGTVTKSVNYSVLYMKAVKALQEAMARIETLEAKVAALEAQ